MDWFVRHLISDYGFSDLSISTHPKSYEVPSSAIPSLTKVCDCSLVIKNSGKNLSSFFWWGRRQKNVKLYIRKINFNVQLTKCTLHWQQTRQESFQNAFQSLTNYIQFKYFKIEQWLSVEVLVFSSDDIYKLGGAKDSQQKFSQICLNYFKNSHIPSYAIPRARHFWERIRIVVPKECGTSYNW